MEEADQAPPRDKDMAAEYDFGGDVRGKYAQRYAATTEFVVSSLDLTQDPAIPRKAQAGPGGDVGAVAAQRRLGRPWPRAGEG